MSAGVKLAPYPSSTPSGPGGGVNSVTAIDSTITVAGTASNPTVGINLANVNTWTGTQNFNNGATARNATQDTTISTLIASRSSSTAQVRIGHTSSYSGVRIDDPVGSIARFTSAQGSVQIGTDLGNANSSSIIQAGVERFRVTGGAMENMSTGTIGAAQHGYTRTGNNYIHNVTIGGNYQFNINGVTGFTIQATQVISPRFLASGFTTSAATAPFRGAAGNSSALFYPGGVMDSTVTEQSNSLTTETTLYNFTVLAQTINRAAGQGIQLKAGGIFATPGAGARLRVRFDGTELFNSGDLGGLVTTESWYIDMCIDRGNSANTIIWIAKLYIDGIPPIVQSGSQVVTMTGNVDLDLTAEGTDDDQFFLQLAKVFYDPMA